MPVTKGDTVAAQLAAAATKPTPTGSKVLSRRLATGFALVSLVALAMCVVLDVLLAAVETSVVTMQSDEVAIREGLALASAVREQYIHQAHMLVGRSDGHLGHYLEWVQKVREGANSLRTRLPASEHWRINAVIADSAALDELFQQKLLPAVHSPDFEQVLQSHNGELQNLSANTVVQADALAHAAEAGMAMEHHHAIRASRLGLLAGATCMSVIVLLSVLYTRRLRRSVLAPLASIVAATERFGRGEFDKPVGSIGEGELQAVADGFDHMVQELRTREQKLLASERMAVIGQFAAGVAHEFNNPIGVIRGYLKTMKPSQPPEMLNEELKILDEEAAACQRIAEDLLSFAGPIRVQCSWFAVDDLLASVTQRFTESGGTKGRQLQLSAEPCQLFADAGRLRQVLSNLLRNAVQASPEGSAIDVGGAISSDRKRYELTVADRGPGVAERDKARIFEPFFSTHDGGSGLGLAVCHGIVAAHSGSIVVEDRSEGGASFRVALPLEPAAERDRS
jgi:signal transduction histidine kinase